MTENELPEGVTPFPDDAFDVQEIKLTIALCGSKEKPMVHVYMEHSGGTKTVHRIVAAEFLTSIAAQESSLGFEKTLELISKGALDYKILGKGTIQNG